MSTEFEIAGNTYRIGKLSTFTQLHVSRRMAPLIPKLIPVFVKLFKDGALTKDLNGLAEILPPLADGIATMSDEDSEYVIGNCLSVVQRSHVNGWTAVWDSQNKACMFDDIDLGVILQLVMRVIQSSLGSFISGLLMSQASGPRSGQDG